MPGLIIGIVVVIILILGARMLMSTPATTAPNSGAKNSWKREDGMNYVYGMGNVAMRVEEAGHYSGERVEGFDAGAAWEQIRNRAGTFSNTLQRRLGMGSAGATPAESFSTKNCVGTFDCLHNEMFISQNDVAANTMMSGYQRRSVLPG